ncbi:MAG TPA: hypothetical protein VFC78_16570 [Tepidisphaeraceae bacterium]|nr:hypothetical protein [Tepidisphaeraceae bacterium]
MHVPSDTFESGAYGIALPRELETVMAVGAVAIFLGTVGLCSLPLLAEPVISEYLGRGGVIADRGLINTWGLISSNAGCVLAVALALAGMGLLRFRPWARSLMLAWAWASIALGVAGIYFHVLMLSVATSGQGTPSFCTRVFGLAEWLAWAFGALFAFIVIWALTRPGVKQAFERGRAIR